MDRPYSQGASARAGLRALQGRRELDRLVRRCQAARDAAGPWGAAGPPPLLVKVPTPLCWAVCGVW